MSRERRKRSRSRSRKPSEQDPEEQRPKGDSVDSILNSLNKEFEKDEKAETLEDAITKYLEKFQSEQPFSEDTALNLQKLWQRCFNTGTTDGAAAANTLLQNSAGWGQKKEHEELLETMVQMVLNGPPGVKDDLTYDELEPDKKSLLNAYASMIDSFPNEMIKGDMVWMKLFTEPSHYSIMLVVEYNAYSYVSEMDVEAMGAFVGQINAFLRKLALDADLLKLIQKELISTLRCMINYMMDEDSKLKDNVIQGFVEMFAYCKSKIPPVPQAKDINRDLDETDESLELDMLSLASSNVTKDKESAPKKPDDQTDESSVWEQIVQEILECVRYSGEYEIKWAIIEPQLDFIFDHAFRIPATECASLKDTEGDPSCNCDFPPLTNPAAEIAFGLIIEERSRLLVPYANRILESYKKHPRQDTYSAYIQLYPQIELDTIFFDHAFRKLDKSAIRYLNFEFLKKVALLEATRFDHPNYLEGIEKYLTDERYKSEAGKAIEILVAIAENNPRLFRGRATNYFDAIQDQPDEVLWFSVNKILVCKATIDREEADEAVTCMIKQAIEVGAQSLTEDVLQRLQVVAHSYKDVVEKRSVWIDECSKNPVYRKEAVEVQQILRGKDTGSKSCNIL